MIKGIKFSMVAGVLAAAMTIGTVANAQSDSKKAEMKGPKTVVISGILADLSCGAKGQVMMGSDHNAKNDTHMTPAGEKESCATMCLKGGQPAGLYSKGKITATLLADASQNLYKFAAKDVEIEGFWAGNKKSDVKTFFPAKIRAKGTTKWTDVKASAMH